MYLYHKSSLTSVCTWANHSRKIILLLLTSQNIYAEISTFWQNKVVPLDQFSPKEITAQDQEAGLYTMSQFPTQAVRMISGDNPSQFPSQSEDTRTPLTGIAGGRTESLGEGAKHSSMFSKKARLLEDDGQKGLLSSGVHQSLPISNTSSLRDNGTKDTDGVSNVVPDVAAAIEDLLEQTSKVNTLVILYLLFFLFYYYFGLFVF